MDHGVGKREKEEPERTEYLASSVWLAFKSFTREQTLKYILSDSCKQPITDFKNIVDNVKLDGRLSSNPVVHPARIKIHKNRACGDHKKTLEDVSFIVRQ